MDKNSLEKEPICFSGNIFIQEPCNTIELINKTKKKSSYFHKDKNSDILWSLHYSLHEQYSKTSLKTVKIHFNKVYQ